MINQVNQELFSFIESSPTAFHAVETMKQMLDAEGYQQLLESQAWELQTGGKYYVMRNGTSLLAFRIPKREFAGFQVMAGHSDSPTFRIKENPEMETEGAYVKLNVEKYGGMLCSHAVETMKQMLDAEGYQQLLESRTWDLQTGGKYYVMRNGTSLLAFRIPKREFAGFQVMAGHSDSPTFRIKENPEMETECAYVKLNVEKYGGMLCSPWFDRPLSVAGRLIEKTDTGIVSRLVKVDRDLLLIPSLAIHMNRKANEEQKYNVQKDMLPLYAMADAKDSFQKIVADAAGVEVTDILGSDLFLYNRVKGTIWGAEREFISSGRLDDLQCVFGSLKGFLAAEEGTSIPMHCVFDNEEVGSSTKQGAASTFLQDTLLRICESLGKTAAQYRQLLASSFMISADNAHAVHPNYGEKSCPTNRPVLNGGIVIKYSANQKYAERGNCD